ncbi:hypothetical protein SMX48_003361 [Cronobacter sakazakii]|nr:hypothetical protein [Cronobacter sakazakii]ELY3593821.1 hypothetical protein [Cronobacter sakazakii]ELY3605966.1 hypothetical protein [Cronobacter sakazakii]
MDLNHKELDEIISKIIMTALFDALDEKQREKFFDSAYRLIDGLAYCDSTSHPNEARLAQALRDGLKERLADSMNHRA